MNCIYSETALIFCSFDYKRVLFSKKRGPTKRTFFSYIFNNVSNISMNLDSEEKFIQLMTLEKASLKRFVKFLIDIRKHRKSILLT